MAQGSTRSSVRKGNSDFVVAGILVFTVITMVIPLPAWLLDYLITINFTFTLLVLLVTVYTKEPLDFSVYPSMLILATMYRLALNISATRLILLHGDQGPEAAGNVIKSFGMFVVGGSYVVGIIVFAILVIINFMVITKGATRIAEVAARFTLDAMPGKQMSIDADLNAGNIDEAEARRRREKISREADFYGAMDGASKFVRGDAIAAMIITAINILGGFAIGVLQAGKPVGWALQTYTLLTIGDGLVSQIPSLLISTSAGIIVTRAGAKADLGFELTSQIFGYPRALIAASGVLILFALIPGLPGPPFIILAGVTGFMGYSSIQSAKKEQQVEEAVKNSQAGKKPIIPDKIESLLTMDMLELEVGYAIIPLVDPDQNGDLLNRIKAIRRQFAMEMGVVIPPIHIRDNLQLAPTEYSIILKGVEIAKWQVKTNYYLAINPGEVKGSIRGLVTREPSFGLEAVWISEADKDRAQILGYTVVDVSTIIATHITELIKANAHELVGRQEVTNLINVLSEKYPKVAEEVKAVDIGLLTKIIQLLVKEQIPIKDLVTIMETIADNVKKTTDVEVITEFVRQSLKRTITRLYMGPNDMLSVFTLDPGVEEIFNQSLGQDKQTGQVYLYLEPNYAQRFINKLTTLVENYSVMDVGVVLLVSPQLRRHVKKLIGPFLSQLPVLSYAEVDPKVNLKTVELVRVDG